MNTVPNIDVCLSPNPKAYPATISSLAYWLQDLVNHLMIHMICTAITRITKWLKTGLKQGPDQAIMQHVNCQLPGFIRIRRLNDHRTKGKII